MRVLEGLEALPWDGRDRGCAATIGVFDGVHLGHREVLRRVVAEARRQDAVPAVVTFASHPKAVLVGRTPPAITTLAHRLVLFRRAGIGLTLVLEFSPGLRARSAPDFLREVLVQGLGLRTLVLGFDSKFGRNREGTLSTLEPMARELGVGLVRVPALRLGGRAVSSSAIREAVGLGELERAAAMLGRPPSLLGTVVRGEGRGRRLGFPTANLDLHHELRPPVGVYAGLVLRRPAAAEAGAPLLPAVVNVGRRPTFGPGELLVEVHLLDWSGDLYGEVLEVFFLACLRGEEAFAGPEELARAIDGDVARARKILTGRAEEGLAGLEGTGYPLAPGADSSAGRARD